MDNTEIELLIDKLSIEIKDLNQQMYNSTTESEYNRILKINNEKMDEYNRLKSML